MASELALALNLQVAEDPATTPVGLRSVEKTRLTRKAIPAPSTKTTVADIPDEILDIVCRSAGPFMGSNYREKNPFWIYRVAWGHVFGRNCMDCGTRMIFGTESSAPQQVWGILATIDHVEQRSRGGSDSRENLQVICACCNGARQLYDPNHPRKSIKAALSNLDRRREQAILHAYEFLWPHIDCGYFSSPDG